MIGRSAGDDIKLADICQSFLVDAQIDHVIKDCASESIPEDAGLFMDLLHHKVLISALFCGFRREGDRHAFFFDLVAVQVIKMRFARNEASHLEIVNIVDLPRVI